MANAAATTTSVTQGLLANRHARLDAAIANFRSEASASGYIVEEVRLRVPIPDTDVIPRVVIAQNTDSGGGHPGFQQSKQHRGLPLYPSPNRNALSSAMAASPFLRSRPAQHEIPSGDETSPGNAGQGFKRTVSGSVIQKVPGKPFASETLSNQSRGLNQGTNTNASHTSSMTNINTSKSFEAPRGKFWNTVISEAQAKMDIDSRSTKKETQVSPGTIIAMRNDQNISDRTGGRPKSPEPMEDEKVKMETKTKVTYSPLDEKGFGTEKKENSYRINQHNIPDSHVQLLLSSAAEIPVRPMDSSCSSSPPRTEPDRVSSIASPNDEQPQNKKADTTFRISPTRNRTSRGKREGSDRERHKSSAARPFRCSKCPSSFDREGHLRVHILAVHEKKRPFVCQACDSAFGHSSSLLRHVRTVHQASPAVGPGNKAKSGKSDNRSGGERGDCSDEEEGRHFRCSACSTAFSRVAQLNRHVATKHALFSTLPSAKTSESNQRCRICSVRFSSIDSLISHMKEKHKNE